MIYRVSELEVPASNPFQHDVLARKPLVDFLAGLISRAGGPFVLALDAPWGSGKTTLVTMLKAELERQAFQCIYFNAWRVDHAIDPLVALVSSVDRVQLAAGAGEAKFKEHVKAIRKVTTLVARRGAVAAAKALTMGALDLEKEVEDVAAELAGDTLTDLVAAFKREEELIERFRAELQKAVALLPEAGKKSTLVWFIDELDRCRPTFAIELLERVKHLFDVANVLFVLSIDKQQLEASTAAVYGKGIRSAEYLRRFIDLEYAIPTVKGERFTEALLQRFGLEPAFASRTASEIRYDRKNFVSTFTALADVYNLSLRARERCITRMCVVMDQTPPDRYLDPILVSALLVLRSNAPTIYRRLCSGQMSPTEVMEAIAEQPDGGAFCEGRVGIVLEAYLMASDENGERVAARHAELEKTKQGVGIDPVVARRAGELLEMRKHVPGMMRSGFRLSWVAAKIDLADAINS